MGAFIQCNPPACALKHSVVCCIPEQRTTSSIMNWYFKFVRVATTPNEKVTVCLCVCVCEIASHACDGNTISHMYRNGRKGSEVYKIPYTPKRQRANFTN